MTRLFIALFVLMISFPAAAEKPYTVENVKINMKGINPVEARDKAFEAAQTKAFKALFRSLNNGQDVSFDESRIPSLIADFELVDEQIAPNHYAATYTFRFKRLASEEFARETQYAQGLPVQQPQTMIDPNAPYNPANYQKPDTPYSDLYAGQSSYQQPGKGPLLLPYWKAGETVSLWGQDNRWSNTWQRLENTVDQGSGFLLPIGDLSDMRATSAGLPESRDAISQLMARYQTNRIIVAVGERAVSSITTTLYRADENGLTFWKVVDSPIGPSTDPYSVAAGQVMAELRGNSDPAQTTRMPVTITQNNISETQQPSQTPEPFFQSAKPPVQDVIRAESRFNSPKEWLDLKAKMTPENGISNIRVLSLTPRSATVEMQLSEPVLRVQQYLGNNSVALKEHGTGNGSYIMQFMGS